MTFRLHLIAQVINTGVCGIFSAFQFCNKYVQGKEFFFMYLKNSRSIKPALCRTSSFLTWSTQDIWKPLLVHAPQVFKLCNLFEVFSNYEFSNVGNIISSNNHELDFTYVNFQTQFFTFFIDLIQQNWEIIRIFYYYHDIIPI